jgi:Septum formation
VRTVRVVAPLVTALLVLGAACDDDEADPTQARDLPVLQVQDRAEGPVCMLVDEDFPPEVEKLPVIGCEESHTHEIYARVEYDDKSVYPGVEELGTFAEVACLEQFEPFVGTSAFDSTLSYSWLVPTLGSWNDEDDREVLCVLSARDGAALVGSVQSTGV